MKRRWLLTLSVSFALLLGSSSVASAVVPVPIDAENMAVHVNHAFSSEASGTVVGNTYIADGNATFSGATKAKIGGLVYYKSGMATTYPLTDPGWFGFSDQLEAISPTLYEGVPIDLVDEFPVITNYIPEYLQHWTTLPNLTISENTHIGALNVGDMGITVDASAKDIYLVVDDLSFEWGKAIKLIGTHNLYLFIDEFTGSGQLTIKNSKGKNNTDSEKVYILSNDDIGHANLNLYAHVYYTDTAPLTPLGIISGSLVTNTTNLNIGTNSIVNGLVYAPLASATVTNSGKIIGRIVADELVLSGSGRIEYNSSPLQLPSQFLKHEVTTATNIPGAGTVSPSSKAANYGEVVNFVATPNSGYRFTGFTSSVSSMVPDASGNITVTGAVTITACFEATGPVVLQVPSVIPENPVNGLLGEYYDASEPINPSALKIKRIDSRVAFAIGYGSPHERIEPETFSMRWTGYIKPLTTGDYTFKTFSDDGIRVNIGGETIIDNWGALSLAYSRATDAVRLEAGKYYEITVEYQQLPLYAAVYLFWESPEVLQELVPSSVLFVKQADYDNFINEQYFNTISKEGIGFTNKFYTVNNDHTPNELMRTETNNIAYQWQKGAPDPITDDSFYGEMTGYIQAKFTETTTLCFRVDDGIKVWFNDELVISEWDWHNVDTFEYSFDAIAGQKYKIHVEYIELGLGATCVMSWKGDSVGSQVIPKEYMYTVE
ncbi:MAG: PA14 domain-containing protein [Syntrophomonadaceae bacterium]|nr:PA14 domain-containing protein [Syntrophomonadaceae bacterium]